MLDVPIYNTAGEKIDTLQVDEERFGKTVNVPLLKQVIVAYRANRRQGSASTRGRSQVSGSTRKLFRQKGTGRARRGNIRTNVLRGGGVAFAKTPGGFEKGLPRKMRRKALDSAILAKILGQDLLVLDELSVSEPKTKVVAEVMVNLKINRSCLLTIGRHDEVLWKSARNLPDVHVCVAGDLNALEVVNRQKMVITREAMNLLLDKRA